jgi:hypothetical protein
VFLLPSTLTAGAYEVRLFADNTQNRIAASNIITVTAPGPSVSASPSAPVPGGTLTASWSNIAAPTAADWIGLYPVGNADANYTIRTNTTGRASDRLLMTLPGSLSAGSYELRLFANNTFTRLATSNSFGVATGTGLSVNQAAVAAGGILNVSWTGIPTPTTTDWIVLVPVGAVDANWVAWTYLNGAASGSIGLSIPASVPMGSYEVHLLAHDTWQRLAVSNIVKVGPTVVMSPTTVASGGTVTITWAGIPSPTTTDWFALVPINAPDTSWVAWLYADGRAGDSLTFTLPPTLPAGTYDLRLLANNSFTRLGISNPVTVTGPGPTLTTSPIAVASGATLTAAWQGIAAPSVNNWIGVYAVGAPDASFLTRVFTNGQVSGTTPILPGALALGSYELRLFADLAFTRLAVSNGFTVIPGPAVHAAPLTISKGGTVTVTWEGMATPTPTDWFSLTPLGATDDAFVSWTYSTGGASGSVNLSVPASTAAGTYEVRFFAQNTWQRLAISNVVVIAP